MNKEILSLGADKGIQVISVYTYAPAHYFGKQPIQKLDDFKGKKLRVNATAAERAKMRQFGAICRADGPGGGRSRAPAGHHRRHDERDGGLREPEVQRHRQGDHRRSTTR